MAASALVEGNSQGFQKGWLIMLSITLLFIALLLSGAIFTFLFPLLTVPFLMLGSRLQSQKNMFNVIGMVSLIWQGYGLLSWCDVALHITHRSAYQLDERNSWLHLLIGFVMCVAPVIFMTLHDYIGKHAVNSPYRKIRTLGTIGLVIIGFWGFQFVPQLELPWLWVKWFI